jgi:hypothetical protein
MVTITKRINQIYQKVDAIAKKGKDGYLDYVTYLDELVSQGEWTIFQDMMLKKYQIDVRQYKSVDLVKSKTFEKVRFYTLDDFQQELKDFYKSEGIYQNGFDVYNLSDNSILGQIYEFEEVKENFPLYKDTELAVKEKVIILHLEARRSDGTYLILNDDYQSLLDKYKEAIAFFTSL